MLKRFDMLSAEVGLVRNGNSKFKTAFGGWYTLFTFIIVFWYAIIMIADPLQTYNLNETSASQIGIGINAGVGATLSDTVIINGIEFEGSYEVRKSTHYIDNFSYNTTAAFRPHQVGFQVGIYEEEDFDTDSFDFAFYQATLDDNGWNFESLSFDYWNITNFPEELREELIELDIEYHICIVDTEDVLYYGYDHGAYTSFLIADIFKWHDSSACRSDDFIEEKITNSSNLGFLYIDTSYNYGNLANPLNSR